MTIDMIKEKTSAYEMALELLGQGGSVGWVKEVVGEDHPDLAWWQVCEIVDMADLDLSIEMLRNSPDYADIDMMSPNIIWVLEKLRNATYSHLRKEIGIS